MLSVNSHNDDVSVASSRAPRSHLAPEDAFKTTGISDSNTAAELRRRL